MQVLAYNSNLHPAEHVVDLIKTLDDFSRQVREQLAWDRLGIDLRLGSVAIEECVNDIELLQGLRACLDRNRLSAHTINAFPLSAFQVESVKDQAYVPDWTTEQRLSDSIKVIDIALALSDDDFITVSTLPCSFKPWAYNQALLAKTAQQFGRWVAAADRAYEQTGRCVHLAIEPEPWCFLEHSVEVCSFWKTHIAGSAVDACAEDLSGNYERARSAIKRHLGICFDTCHVSLAYEDQAMAVRALSEADIPIFKVQFSAAPEIHKPHSDKSAVAQLAAMHEPRFLHQTAVSSAAGSIWKIPDLDQMHDALAHMPGAETVRSHFHIPVFWPAQESGLSSTIADSIVGLRACMAAGARHIAVETYTWSVLADNDRDAIAGTVKELQFLERVIQQMDNDD